ncbi:MAG: VWA domain-containing protein [Thermodesulfobacteriota bacterium]|nr:VWA domain-containing protein [Thermodesulfobacteriota bacterium]
MKKGQIRKKIGWSILVILSFFYFYAGRNFLSVSMAKGPLVNCRVDLDRDVLLADNPQNVVVKVTLCAPEQPGNAERPPANLAIVLDRSGSMSGQKLEKAKDAAIFALRRLGPQDIFSVIVYDHNVKTIVPAQSARNVEWIESRIKEIRPGGNTALFGGVSQGASEIRKNLKRKYVHRIILLSDGIANVGPSSPEDLGRLGAALLKEDISVTTIGVGTDYNEDLMTNLSQNSDGNTYFVESSMDLPRIFAAELGDTLSVVAKNVHVIIECPDGIKPVRIIGREGRIKGRIVEMSMNQLYGGQEKYALVEVVTSAGKSGEDMEVAIAKVTYENPFTLQKETSKGRAKAMLSKDSLKVEKSVNVSVQRELQFNLDALAQEEAINLSDQGKSAAAIRKLKSSAQKLRSFGIKYNDKEVLDKAEDLEKKADIIKTEGMTKKHRKELRTKSYQIKNQQSSY